TAAAHLAETDDSITGLDLDDGPDEATPVCTVAVPQGAREGHGHRGGADIGDQLVLGRHVNSFGLADSDWFDQDRPDQNVTRSELTQSHAPGEGALGQQE